MAKRPRKNYMAAFKAKVGLEAIKGEQTLVELLDRLLDHPNQCQVFSHLDKIA